MRLFDDGRIDRTRLARSASAVATEVSADDVRQEIDTFRGRVLSAAYALGRRLDALMLWHLFGTRQDGSAAFFERSILDTLGLDRKVKISCDVAQEWSDEEDDEGWIAVLPRAKQYRDRVAHWPAWLQPLETLDGRAAGFLAHMEKGSQAYPLTGAIQQQWLETIAAATAGVEATTARIAEFWKSGLADS